MRTVFRTEAPYEYTGKWSAELIVKEAHRCSGLGRTLFWSLFVSGGKAVHLSALPPVNATDTLDLELGHWAHPRVLVPVVLGCTSREGIESLGQSPCSGRKWNISLQEEH